MKIFNANNPRFINFTLEQTLKRCCEYQYAKEVFMSWNAIQGNWRQFIGAAKQRWAKLTDSDLAECEGNRDKLVGKLQELYGISADQAGEEIADRKSVV